ncbi:MAG: putative esterase, partial [Frankiales bacterium]|nr:putative esterase [Frankiales bacterium]
MNGSTVGWGLYKPAPGTLPLLLVLHGKGGKHESAFVDLHLDRALKASGQRFAIATVDGGKDSYYHPRRSGLNPQRMILDELLPVLAKHGVRTDSFAVGGWSMGGYGALLLAELLGPQRVPVVAVDSPALYLSAGSTPQGAFDSAEDFHRHDVLRY